MTLLRSAVLFVFLGLSGVAGLPGGSGVAWAAPASSAWQASYDAEVRGDYRASLEALEQLTGADRDTYLFHLRRGWLRTQLLAYEDAVGDYQAAVDKEPGAIEPRLGLTLPLMGLRRWRDLLTVCDEVLAKDPLSYSARASKAWGLYNLGRYGEAATTYRAVLADYPGDVEMKAGLAWSLHLDGRSALARKLFEEILAIAPNHATATTGLAATR